MSERLRPRDLAFLAGETPTTPRHVATVEIFDPGPSGFDHARFLALVADRIAFVPRYRQLVRPVPGRLATPVWVDDPAFDLNFHVRRSALPRPGTAEQLRELVGRIVSRPLDRSRPLWEVYVVEGLKEGRIAILSKSHQLLVDGVHTVDLGQVLLDTSADPKTLEHDDDWRPRPRPSAARLVRGAVRDNLTHPGTLVGTARAGASAAADAVGRRAGRVGDVAGALAGRRPEPRTPFEADLSQQRRFVGIATDLADYRLVRQAHGGTVNDVVLATVTGGLRGWLMTRTESMGGLRRLRAVVPMSVIDDDLEATQLGTQVAAHLVDLPIGETSPVVRLHQVSYSFKAHSETGRAVAANRLAGIAGFAPTTFHALGARVAQDELRRGFDVAVTNVPGPQFPLYAAGARMLESYPVHPLLPGHALAIGVTSYDGGVYYGITADRDAVPDADVLGQCLREALDELVDASRDDRDRAPRGRDRGRGRRGPGART